MQSWKRRLVWAFIVVAALLIVPFLIPMSAYIKQAETLASNMLGAPVRISAMRISLLPSPRLHVRDVVIGKNQEFSVKKLAVMPTLTSLFSDHKTISSIVVTKPMIKKAALDIMANLSKQPQSASSMTTVSIRQIKIEDAKLDWPGIRLPAMNANIALNADNKPETVKIESIDGKLKLDITPQDNQQLIAFTAKAWTLPVDSPLRFDTLQMQMVLRDKRLQIQKIDGALYGGKLSGNVNLSWEKVYKLNGKVKLDNLAVREPANIMSKSTRVSGQLASSGNFSASAKEAAQLADNLRANIAFKVADGVLYGFDLAKAPLMLLGQGKGGETKFDEFSGLLNITGKQYQFSNLNISSGLMTAKGAVKINPNKTLDGVVKVAVKNSASMADIPLQVSGSLEHPTVFPTKSAIAGALAGTAVLGPGVGTSLGIKAGGVADKLKGLFD